MNLTEFIKLIKDCQPDRKRMFIHNWGKGTKREQTILISQSELDKIKNVYAELLRALTIINGAFWTDGEEFEDRISDLKQIAQKAIENTTNIKQV